jgi:hypothetical protein
LGLVLTCSEDRPAAHQAFRTKDRAMCVRGCDVTLAGIVSSTTDLQRHTFLMSSTNGEREFNMAHRLFLLYVGAEIITSRGSSLPTTMLRHIDTIPGTGSCRGVRFQPQTSFFSRGTALSGVS